MSITFEEAIEIINETESMIDPNYSKIEHIVPRKITQELLMTDEIFAVFMQRDPENTPYKNINREQIKQVKKLLRALMTKNRQYNKCNNVTPNKQWDTLIKDLMCSLETNNITEAIAAHTNIKHFLENILTESQLRTIRLDISSRTLLVHAIEQKGLIQRINTYIQAK